MGYIRYGILMFALLSVFGCANESRQKGVREDSAVIQSIVDEKDESEACVTIEAELAPSPDSIYDSAVLLLKLRNNTDGSIGYGEMFRLYRRESDEWREVRMPCVFEHIALESEAHTDTVLRSRIKSLMPEPVKGVYRVEFDYSQPPHTSSRYTVTSNSFEYIPGEFD